MATQHTQFLSQLWTPSPNSPDLSKPSQGQNSLFIGSDFDEDLNDGNQCALRVPEKNDITELPQLQTARTPSQKAPQAIQEVDEESQIPPSGQRVSTKEPKVKRGRGRPPKATQTPGPDDRAAAASAVQLGHQHWKRPRLRIPWKKFQRKQNEKKKRTPSPEEPDESEESGEESSPPPTRKSKRGEPTSGKTRKNREPSTEESEESEDEGRPLPPKKKDKRDRSPKKSNKHSKRKPSPEESDESDESEESDKEPFQNSSKKNKRSAGGWEETSPPSSKHHKTGKQKLHQFPEDDTDAEGEEEVQAVDKRAMRLNEADQIKLNQAGPSAAGGTMDQEHLHHRKKKEVPIYEDQNTNRRKQQKRLSDSTPHGNAATASSSKRPQDHNTATATATTSGATVTSKRPQDSNTTTTTTSNAALATKRHVRTVATFNAKEQPVGDSRGKYLKEGQFGKTNPEYNDELEDDEGEKKEDIQLAIDKVYPYSEESNWDAIKASWAELGTAKVCKNICYDHFTERRPRIKRNKQKQIEDTALEDDPYYMHDPELLAYDPEIDCKSSPDEAVGLPQS
ncbi:hypothetical protein DFH27DRAFT_529257 [Peziza echinospora]|nr:hypothetical protein DFH27DRAFT_529257 [Peziza echinospora]